MPKQMGEIKICIELETTKPKRTWNIIKKWKGASFLYKQYSFYKPELCKKKKKFQPLISTTTRNYTSNNINQKRFP